MSAAEHVGLDDITRPVPDPPTPPEELYAISPVDSWVPIDLVHEPDDPPVEPTVAVCNGVGLIYPGKAHLWSGEPGSGKSWLALIACALEILEERHVFYFDFETDKQEIKQRLRALAVANYELGFFHYFKPVDPIGAEGVREHVNKLLATLQPSLIVVDAFAGLLDLHQLDPNIGADIEKLKRAFFDPLRAHGAATVTLDHLSKDREKRGRYSIGSERKLGIVDVHLQFSVARPFGRGKTGTVRLRSQKDRPGFLGEGPLCDYELASDGETVTYAAKTPKPIDDAHPFRPTALMERVSRYLEIQTEPVFRSKIEADVSGKGEYLRVALDMLVKEGYVAETEGAKQGAHVTRLYASVKAYRESDDEKLQADDEDADE